MSVYNKKHNVIFIHVPRTAGTSMEQREFLGGGGHYNIHHYKKSLSAQDFDGAVVDFKGIVEGDLIIVQAEVFSTFMSFSHLLGEFYQFVYYFCCFNGTVLVFTDSFF